MSIHAKRHLDLRTPAAAPDREAENRPRAESGKSGRFVVRPKALDAHPGLDFDDIEGLLDHLEGPRRQ